MAVKAGAAIFPRKKKEQNIIGMKIYNYYRSVILMNLLLMALSGSAQGTPWRYSTMSKDWFSTDTGISKVAHRAQSESTRKKKNNGSTHYFNRQKKDTCGSSAAIQIKTNALYDAALAPNGGVELTLGKKWTVGMDGFIAWIRNKETDLWYQYYGFDVYGRYWFVKKQDAAMTGLHIGAYAGTLTYDLFPTNTGYQCDKLFHTFRVGAEIGYSIPIGKKVLLDCYGGIGLFHTRQDKYKSYGNGKYYKTIRRYRNYPDFTRLGVTFGYKLGQ